MGYETVYEGAGSRYHVPLLGKWKPLGPLKSHPRPRDRAVTTCVAVLCENRQAIVLVADKMVGAGFVESESATKIFPLHENWRVMIAGNGIEPAFQVIDRARKALRARKTPDVTTVSRLVQESFQAERLAEAESRFLSPRGLTMKRFVSEGKKVLTESDLIRLGTQIDSFDYDIDLLVAGFDGKGEGYLFSVCGGDRGVVRRHDLGAYATGSGAINATFILNYREIGPQIPLREALYYAVEAKFYGEFATAVGLKTDVYILGPRGKELKVDEETVENKLMKICERLSPRELRPGDIAVLNELPVLKQSPKLTTGPKTHAVYKVKVVRSKAA